jgi:hypothetical protein
MAAATGSMLYAVGVARAMDVVLNWAPARADIDQLRRERHAETAGLMGYWAQGCLAVAALMGLAGIALAWHRVVPGAMCGTGVLQAMGIDGSRAIIFWGVSLTILYCWRVLDRLDNHHPEGVLTQVVARALICAVPFIAMAVFYSWQALMRVENVPPVSCCAAVYDQVLTGTSGMAAGAWLVSICLWGSLAGSAVLLALAALNIRSADHGSGALPAVFAIFWAIGATIAVKQVWSAYYYQVLSHPCPWCLFLPDYYGAGFFIFGCLAVVVLESTALWLADGTRRRHPVLAVPASRRMRQAAWRITIALIGYTVLTVGPAIVWRLRNGIWLDGSL